MPRIPPVSEETLTPAQRRVYDKVVAGPRGTVIGPLRAVLHSPELADRWQALGEYLRFNSCLPMALRELAIIAAGRYWNSQLEWLIHARLAHEAGIGEQIIDAIRTSNAPEFKDADEAAVYALTRELLHTGQASDVAYDVVRTRFGTIGVVELTALVGYYTMVAMTLNAHEVPLPSVPTSIQPLNASRASADTLPPPTHLAPGRLVVAARTESA